MLSILGLIMVGLSIKIGKTLPFGLLEFKLTGAMLMEIIILSFTVGNCATGVCSK